MKYFIEYLDINPITGKLYSPCGDRSVVILDGRNNLNTMIHDAIKFNGYRRPRYKAFRIMKGNFYKAKEIYYGTLE